MKSIAIILMATLTGAIACAPQSGVKVTFFGYPDNDPPGPATAYDCGRGFQAGGTGTYADPVSFASATGEFNKCEIIYLPYIKKYVRHDDYCGACQSDWGSGSYHIDIWTGTTGYNGGQNQLNCENSLTPGVGQSIVRYPPPNYEVDTSNLYYHGTCFTDKVYPANSADNYCF